MTIQMQVATIEPGNAVQADAVAQQAAKVLRAGGLVAFPTETVYGVGTSSVSDRGVHMLRELLAGGESRAFAVHLPDPAMVERYIDMSSLALQRLVRKVFPGPVTLQVEVSDELIDKKLKCLEMSGLRDRLYDGRLISLRCPDHALTRRILGTIDEPIVAGMVRTVRGEPAREASEVVEAMGDRVDLVVDGGRCRYAKPSTVVRVTGRGPTRSIDVVREGVYDKRYMRKLMHWTMLLICSGNTCRSPMAEGLAKHMLAQERGLRVDELDAAGLTVLSAGVSTLPGMPANPYAIQAMAKQGIDLTQHRSRELTPELIRDADVIYTMTESHRLAVIDMMPSAAEKTFTLDPTGDVDDPIGTGATSYQRTAELIRRRLAQRLKEQQP